MVVFCWDGKMEDLSPLSVVVVDHDGEAELDLVMSLTGEMLACCACEDRELKRLVMSDMSPV